jgi:hypothetical protein
MTVVGYRVPARLDATHFGFVFIDVMGDIHCFVPLRSISDLQGYSERGVGAPALAGGTGGLGLPFSGMGTHTLHAIPLTIRLKLELGRSGEADAR